MRKTHNSYGLIGFHRQTSTKAENLFGSSLKHRDTINMTVYRAGVRRDGNMDWYSTEEQLISVDLSPNQFADLITSMNVGFGVPCTITRYNNEAMEECPFISQQEQFIDEFKETCDKIGNDSAGAKLNQLQEILAKKTIGTNDRTKIFEIFNNLINDIKSNIPWIHKEFSDAMDKTVTEAKASVEAFVQNKIISLGSQALIAQAEQSVPKMPEFLPGKVEQK